MFKYSKQKRPFHKIPQPFSEMFYVMDSFNDESIYGCLKNCMLRVAVNVKIKSSIVIIILSFSICNQNQFKWKHKEKWFTQYKSLNTKL